MFKVLIWLFIIPSIFLTGCTDIFENEDVQENSSIINCSVSVLDAAITRGIPIINANDTAFKNIGLFGYRTNDKFDISQNPTPNFFDNIEVAKTKDNKWSLGKNYFWPQTGYISFFAYSPMETADNGIKVNQNQSGGYPSLTYTLPSDVVNQPDLMIATPRMDLFKTEVSLELSHALACISFDVSGEDVPIEYIGVKGVYTTAQLSLNLIDKLPDWQSLGNYSNDLYKVGLKKDAQATNPADTVMATNGYLMMIPQQLNDEAAIVIKFKGIDEKTIYFKNINTTEWKAGYKYNYMLKEGIYNFVVTPNNYTCPYSGGSVQLDFTSTYTNADNTVSDLGWTVDLVDATPNDAYWTDLFNHLASADGTLKSKTISILPSLFTTTDTIDLRLQNNDSVPYSKMKDLSYNGTTYNTQNTYLVNSAGWFKIPCTVMGNAIVNGNNVTTPNNSNCFVNEAGSLFVDYGGNSITSLNNLLINTSNATVELLWSDAPNLISNVSLSADKQYIQFYVNHHNIRQGNAVLAIKNGNQIMWSWQIWVTNWNPMSEYQVLGSGVPNIMPFGVGRCSAAVYNYSSRNVTLRFTQNTTGLVQEVTITQDGRTLSYGENAVYYQWGRKDPMVGTDGITGNNKDCFGDATFEVAGNTTTVPLQDGIQNPNLFYTAVDTTGNWNSPINFYLWGNLSAVSSTFVKTIYDPCPQGYQVMTEPTLMVFLNFQFEFVTTPIKGCRFSTNNNGTYNVFLASNGIRSQHSTVIGLNSNPQMGAYWSNSNFYWGPGGEINSFLNLLYPSPNGPLVYYQANNSACGLNVCGSQIQ